MCRLTQFCVNDVYNVDSQKCALVWRVMPKLSRIFRLIFNYVQQEEMLCNNVETVREFAYMGAKMSVCCRCEAAVTARTRYSWSKFRICGRYMYGMRFPLRLKRTVCKTYVRAAILYERET